MVRSKVTDDGSLHSVESIAVFVVAAEKFTISADMQSAVIVTNRQILFMSHPPVYLNYLDIPSFLTNVLPETRTVMICIPGEILFGNEYHCLRPSVTNEVNVLPRTSEISIVHGSVNRTER